MRQIVGIDQRVDDLDLAFGDSMVTTPIHPSSGSSVIAPGVRFDGTQGDSGSFVGDLSSGGRLVSFWSNATNLVGVDTNELEDVFVRGPWVSPA